MSNIVQYSGTGRRKTSVARVILRPGNKGFSINGKELQEYFHNRESLIGSIRKPLELLNSLDRFNVIVNVNGGGLSGQAGAISLGIARALLELDESSRSVLKPEGLLTRDARKVERKKYGKKKARRSPQFSKR